MSEEVAELITWLRSNKAPLATGIYYPVDEYTWQDKSTKRSFYLHQATHDY